MPQQLVGFELSRAGRCRLKPREGLTTRVSRRGTADWGTDTQLAEGRLVVERVSAADPRMLRIVLPCASSTTLRTLFGCRYSSSGKVISAPGGDYGATAERDDMPAQRVLDVPMARLWQLMSRGDGLALRRLELRLSNPATDKQGGPPAMVMVHVDVTQCPWPM